MKNNNRVHFGQPLWLLAAFSLVFKFADLDLKHLWLQYSKYMYSFRKLKKLKAETLTILLSTNDKMRYFHLQYVFYNLHKSCGLF